MRDGTDSLAGARRRRRGLWNLRRAPTTQRAAEDPPRDPPIAAGDFGVITGKVEVIQGFTPTAPVAFEPVALYRGSDVVAKAVTDAHGEFMFVGISGGVYEARIDADGFMGRVRLSIQTGGHFSGARLVVEKATIPK